VNKKQKKLMMIVLGVVAALLTALKLGPVLAGGSPVADPEKRKKLAAKKKAQGNKPPPKPSARRRGPPPRAPGPRSSGQPAPAAGVDWSLESVLIELSAAERQMVPYGAAGLRSPFGPAAFEVRREDAVHRMGTLTLEGIVRTGEGPAGGLAIIEGRVYAVGQEVADGVTVVTVEKGSVVLSDGETEIRLFLSGPGSNELFR